MIAPKIISRNVPDEDSSMEERIISEVVLMEMMFESNLSSYIRYPNDPNLVDKLEFLPAEDWGYNLNDGLISDTTSQIWI